LSELVDGVVVGRGGGGGDFAGPGDEFAAIAGKDILEVPL
jgi:hypothetical protein